MSIEKDLNELSRISFDEFRKGVGEETANLILTGLLGKTLSMKTFIKLVGEDKFKELLIKAPHLVEQALAEKRRKISEKRKIASSMGIEARWGKKQKPKLSAIEISNRKHLFDSSMDMFKQLSALKKAVEVLDETINSSIQTIIDIYLNTEKETKR